MSGDIPHLNQERVQSMGHALISHAETIHRAAGGVDRGVPAVPYDWFDLRHLVVRLDEAREAFDQRLAAAVAAFGQRAVTQVHEASTADRFD